MADWCDECEAVIEGLAKVPHQMACEYSRDVASGILGKPTEWRRHLLAALRSGGMCLSCGRIAAGGCHCKNDE